jgi:hypothetical protein
VNTEALSKAVAARLAYPLDATQRIIETTIDEIIHALLDGDLVFLMRLGRFFVKRNGRRSGKVRYGVFFRAQPSVSQKIRAAQHGNRYYHLLSTNQLALARLTGRCPRCDQRLLVQEPPECGACGALPLGKTP